MYLVYHEQSALQCAVSIARADSQVLLTRLSKRETPPPHLVPSAPLRAAPVMSALSLSLPSSSPSLLSLVAQQWAALGLFCWIGVFGPVLLIHPSPPLPFTLTKQQSSVSRRITTEARAVSRQGYYVVPGYDPSDVSPLHSHSALTCASALCACDPFPCAVAVEADCMEPPPCPDGDLGRRTYRWGCRLLLHLVLVGLVAAVAVLLVVAVVVAVCSVDGGVSVTYELEVWRYSLATAEAECRSKPTSPVVVSLTTLPDRLPYLHRTLKTLLMQSHCPAVILVWIPRTSSRREGVEYRVPQELVAFNESSAVVQLRWAEEDLGPANKLLPTLLALHRQGKDEQAVVVVDDDMLYGRRTQAFYDHYSPPHPHAALGHWGCPATWEGCHWGEEVQRLMPVDVLFGTASYVVKPSSFNLTAWLAYDMTALVSELLDAGRDREALGAAAFYENDLWVALNLLLTSHRLLVIPMDCPRYAPVDTLFFYRGALSHGENADSSNFKRFKDVIANLLLSTEHE